MKKHFLFAAAVAALMTCACSVESVDVVDVQPEEDGEITVLTAGFAGDGDETRTVRQADGKVFWSPGDAISVIRGTSSSGRKKFVSSLSEPSPTASFSGTMPTGSGAFWAVYPYSSSNQIQAVSGYQLFVTSLPAQQEAVAGTFADNLFISAAYVRNNTTQLDFRHVCGGVKFSVTQPGVKRVTLMAADDNVFLAGLVGLYADRVGAAPYVLATGDPGDMSSSIELSTSDGKPLEVGEAYHFVTLPAALSGGFTLLFEKEDGTYAFRKIEKDVTIQAGHFATLLEADKGLEYGQFFEFDPSSVTVDPRGGLFSLTVRSSVDYHVEIASDWIKEVSVSGNPIVGATLTYYAEPNTGEERTGMLIVCDDKNCYPVEVYQGDGTGIKQIVHHSLGMRFTATWCGYCPIMSETFKLAKENLGDKFDFVCIYATYQNSNYSNSAFDPLEDQYLISSWPSGIIDGRFEVQNYESTYAAQLIANAVYETEMNYPVTTAVGLKSSVSGRNVTVDVDVFALAAEDYKLTVMLVEDGIIGYQRDYNDGDHNDFHHDRVLRMCLTSPVTGASISIPEAGETQSFTYSATVPSGFNMDNMAVLAFVQRSFGDRPAIQSGKYGDWYVDNCRSAALGATAPLEVQ